MPGPTIHRFTTREYYRMAEIGVLRPEERVELLDGEIMDLSPISPPHASIVKRLNQHFGQKAKGRWLAAIQDPTHLDEHSEPQPDLMLLKVVADFYSSGHPKPAEVFLLIEVADSSLAYDREKKLPAYGRAGIPEVWIVNLEDGAVEVNREPHLNGYGSTTILRPGDKASPLAFPDATVDVAELLRQI
jgi:Uma2 family endonuclease